MRLEDLSENEYAAKVADHLMYGELLEQFAFALKRGEYDPNAWAQSLESLINDTIQDELEAERANAAADEGDYMVVEGA